MNDSEERQVVDDLTRLLDAANVVVFGTDTDGRVTEWNRKVSKMTGISKERANGECLVDVFVCLEFRQQLDRILADAIGGHETETFEVPLCDVDGGRRYILLSVWTRRGANQEITGVMGVGQEITDRHTLAAGQRHRPLAALECQGESQAQTTEDDLAELIDTANSLIIGIDRSGCITEWNCQVAQLTGFQKTTAKGKSFVQSFISSEYRLQVGSVLAEALEGREKKNVEFPLFTRDGSRREILLSTTARHNAKGEVTSVLCMGQDITNLRATMDERKRHVADDLSCLLETALQPVISVDANGNVTGWNREAAELSGNTKQETLGQPLLDCFVVVDHKAEFQAVLARACQGVGTASFEMTLLNKAGFHKVVQINLTPRWNALGTHTGCVGIIQDITELRTITDPRRIAEGVWRVLEAVTVPVFGINDLGVITQWNQKAVELLGYTEEETLGHPLFSGMVTKGDIDLAETLLGEAYQGSEVSMMTKDGRRLDVLLNATPKRDVNGRVTSVLAIGQEISHLREAVTKANRHADDLSGLIDTANAPIFCIDAEGRVTEWNQQAAIVFGHSKLQTEGKMFVDNFITDDFKPEVKRLLTSVLRGHETANFSFPLFTKDGRRHEILLNATTRRDPDGRVTGVIGVGQDITELNNITAEQQRVADDLQRLIETANAPIFGVSIDGCVTEWNRKAAELSGFTKEETLGRPLVEAFITHDYKDKVQHVLNKACNGVETANFEFPLLTKDGKRTAILLNATTRRNAQGQITGVVGVGQDIANLRTAINEVSRVADDLTRLIDKANAPIFGIDTKGCVTEWNQKAASISGWTKSYTLGKPLVERFISEDYREEVGNVLAMALSGKETANYEFPLFTRDGSRREILLNATTRQGADGEVTGVIGVGQDITELRAMTAEQHRIADDLSRLIETANAPIFGVDVEGKVTEWNRKAARLTGYSKSETMGRPLVEEFITKDYQEKVQTVLTQAMEGTEAANFEFPLSTKDNQRIDILLNATTRRNAQGQVTGVVGVGQEITDLRRAMTETTRIADDLTRVIDTANAPIFGIDTAGHVTEWNQKAAEISGWDRERTLGKPLVESFISVHYRHQVNRVLKEALSGHETANFEFPLFTKDGRRREILLNATARRGAYGEVIGVIGVGQDITQLRALMVEQHRIADDLSRLIETANAPIFGVSVDGLVTEWNKKAAELSGYSKEETLDRPLVQNFITGDYRDQVQMVLTRACQGRETTNFEFPLVTKNNKRVHILLNATTRRDANGEVIGVVGVGQDITELREAMSYSRSVADDLTGLIDTANAPIFGIDIHGCVTEWNRMAYRITRFDKRSVVGKPFVAGFIHVDQRDSVQEVFDRAMKGQEVVNFEMHLHTKSGDKRDILLNATTRRGPDGEVIGVLGVGQDITELNIQRRETERIASDLARLIDTANAPIFGMDVQGCIKEWNRKAAELSGYPKSEIQGQRLVQSLVAEESQHQVAYVLLRALGGEESSDFEFPLITKSGDQRDVLMNATALRGADGEVTGVIGVGHDITEIRQMAAEQKNIADDLARLVRSANAPIFGVNTRGCITEWNDMAAALLGYNKEEVLGQRFVESFVREDVQAEVGRVIDNACHGIETTSFECPLISCKNGEVLVMLNAASRMDASGKNVGMVAVGQDITTLRQTMKDISLVADDLQRIIEHANAPILAIDVQGCVTEWNQKVAEISHYSKEEMLGKHLVETFIHKEYRDEVSRILDMALEGTETDNYEFPLFTKTGGRHEILFNATTRRGADGRITGVIGVGQDITRIRTMTMEQERIADDLSRLIETANAPIFGVDTNGLITEWNRKVEEISGFTKKESSGRPLVADFIHQQHQQAVQAVLDQAMTLTDVGNFELMLYTRGGQQRDILLNATPRKGSRNEVIGVVCVGQDITELNKHRRESERIADDLSRLIETANAPIFGVDKALHITEWNGWVARNSGFRKQDVSGKRLTSFLTKDSRDVVVRIFQEASKGNLTSNFEVELATQIEKPVCLLLNATPRVSWNGDIVGVICVGQDITSMKEIEQKKSSFMAMVSHELKSPLHGVIGLSNALFEHEEVSVSVRGSLTLIHSCATRLLDMVSNIMDASVLVQDKKMKFSRNQVKMEKIVEEVVGLCQHAIDKRGNHILKDGVKLTNDISVELPTIEADQHRCTQVIYNLVTNALKFTHKGFVSVTASSDDERELLTVTVEDSGIGIAPENLVRIFQPFDQEDQDETQRCDGLGLGLAISREVAYRHGGSLAVESVKGEGSNFHVHLPYKMIVPKSEEDEEVEAAVPTVDSLQTPTESAELPVLDKPQAIASHGAELAKEGGECAQAGDTRGCRGKAAGVSADAPALSAPSTLQPEPPVVERQVLPKAERTADRKWEPKVQQLGPQPPNSPTGEALAPPPEPHGPGRPEVEPRPAAPDAVFPGRPPRSLSVPAPPKPSATQPLHSPTAAKKTPWEDRVLEANEAPLPLTTAHITMNYDRELRQASCSSSNLPLLMPEMSELKANKTYNILSVDDDEVNQEVMCATFGKCEHYKVVVLMNGDECLKYVEANWHTNPPELVLLDLMMPGISGFEVLVELRKKYSSLQLPIIMVSAKNSSNAVVRGLELGCNDWVHKPFDRKELISRVKSQLLMKEQIIGLKDLYFPEVEQGIQTSMENLPPISNMEQRTFANSVLRQNAHLVVELRNRERHLNEVQAMLQQQTVVSQGWEEKCNHLKRALMLREADMSFFAGSRWGVRGGIAAQF